MTDQMAREILKDRAEFTGCEKALAAMIDQLTARLERAERRIAELEGDKR